MARLRIVAVSGSHRLIWLSPYGYAVVEARNGWVYSTDSHRRGARDDLAGMIDVVGVAGWNEEAEARALFAWLTDNGRRLAEKIW